MSAQRRPATKRDTSGQNSRRAAGNGRQGGASTRAATVTRAAEPAADVVEASGAAVAAAQAPRAAAIPPRPAASSSSPAKAPKPAPAKTKEPDAKPNAFAERGGRVRKVFDDTRAEMKKITWPDRETTRNLAIVVIGISVVLGIMLGGIDYVLFQIFEALP
jgi:preprotein translocase subunit SecE